MLPVSLQAVQATNLSAWIACTYPPSNIADNNTKLLQKSAKSCNIQQEVNNTEQEVKKRNYFHFINFLL
jgi:hypothetical protein